MEMEGVTGLVSIWAPPGLGKTRLVLEMESSMPSRRFLYLRGDPSPGGTVFGRFLRQWFGLDPRRDPGWNGNAFEKVWQGLVMDPAARHLDMEGRKPFLRNMAGLSADEDTRGTDPEERWERTADSLTCLLDLLAGRHSLAVVLEDLHWFTKDELNMASRIIEGGSGAPRLFVATGRPDGKGIPPGLTDISPLVKALELRLEGLPRHSLTDFLEGSGADRPSRDLEDYLWTVAGGVPLFLGLAVDYLRESGNLKVSAGGTGLAASADPLPSSIEEIFRSRLDLLGPSEREMAAAAAVIGPGASLKEILEMVPSAEPAEGPVPDRLAWILTMDGDGTVFTHEMVREWILGSVPVDQLPDLHLRAAETLAGRKGIPDSPSLSERLAGHFMVGGDTERAAEYLESAARGYAADFRNDLSARLYRSLVPLLEDPGRIRRELDLYDVYKQAGLLREAVDLLTSTLDRIDRDTAPLDLLAEAELRLGESLGSAGRLERAEELVRDSLRMFTGLEDLENMARAHRQLGMILMSSGRTEEALEFTVSSVELARRTGDTRLVCAALYWAAINWREVGDLRRMESCTLEQVELAAASGLTRSIIAGYDNLMRLQIYRGEYGEAEEVHEKLREAAERTANWAALNTAASKMGIIHLRRGETARAADCFRRCVSLSDRTGNLRARCAALGNLAHVAVLMKDTSAAMDCATELIDLAGRIGYTPGMMSGYARMAFALKMMGDLHSALECLQTQIEHAEELKDSRNLSDAWAMTAEIQFVLGDLDGCLASIECALEHSSAAGDMLLGGSQLVQKGRYLFMAGDAGAASGPLIKAMEQNMERKGREHIVFRCRMYLGAIAGNDVIGMLREDMEPEVEAEVHFLHWKVTGDTASAERARTLLDVSGQFKSHPILRAIEDHESS